MFKTNILILGNVVQPDLFIEIFYCRDDGRDADDDDDDAAAAAAAAARCC